MSYSIKNKNLLVEETKCPAGTTYNKNVQRCLTPEEYSKAENKQFGKFMSKGREIENRTDRGRLKDTEVFIQDILESKPDNSSIVIDIGSALGNSNPNLAGITVKELQDNSRISSKATIVATDIPEQMRRWEALKNKYSINTYEVPEDFNTPVANIIKKYQKPAKDGVVILRSSNSIDLIMNPSQRSNHFSYIGNSLKDNEVWYLFGKFIYHKLPGSNNLSYAGALNGRGFDHRGAGWKRPLGKGDKSYSLVADETPKDSSSASVSKEEPKTNNTATTIPGGYTQCSKVLKKKCAGQNVKNMQVKMVQFGKANGLGDLLAPYTPDGVYGDITVKAVKKMQKKLIDLKYLQPTYGPNNLSTIDGMYGKLTQDALNKAINNSTSDLQELKTLFRRFLGIL